MDNASYGWLDTIELTTIVFTFVAGFVVGIYNIGFWVAKVSSPKEIPQEVIARRISVDGFTETWRLSSSGAINSD